MARKAGIIATTIFLGKVGDGWIGWFVITSITVLALALQLLMVSLYNIPLLYYVPYNSTMHTVYSNIHACMHTLHVMHSCHIIFSVEYTLWSFRAL